MSHIVKALGGSASALEYRMPLYADRASETLNGGTISVAADNTITFSLPAGTTTDPEDCTFILWSLNDPNGNAVSRASGGGYLSSLMAKLLEDTAPGLSDDVYVGCGFIDSGTMASAEGVMFGIRYSGGSRRAFGMKITNGAATTSISGAGAMDAVIGAAIMGTNGNVDSYVTAFESSDWTAYTAQIARALLTTFAGDLHFFVGAGRLAATAGTASVAVRAGYIPTTLIEHSGGFS